MADDKKTPDTDSMSVEERFQQVLQSRWDPSKISGFMKSSQRSQGQRLDFSNRSRFERRLGVDLGDVRIFTGELAEEITKAHNAEALTVGSTGMILMRNSGFYAPGSAAGTALLGHELTLVAQGRASAISRKNVSADLAREDASEMEAEHVEQQVLQEEQGGGVSGDPEGAEEDDFMEELTEAVVKMYEELHWTHDMRTHNGK